MNIVTRSQALRQGLKRYFTGKPCSRGHIAERQTSNYTCLECKKIADASDFQKHRKSRMEKSHQWKQSNPSKRRKHLKSYYLKNRDSLLEGRDKQADLARLKQWVKDNPERVNANSARRRAARLQAIPPWADLDAIKALYESCPKGSHVDHIIPLRHPLVCGLHVLENLQILTAEENLKKGNHFREEW